MTKFTGIGLTAILLGTAVAPMIAAAQPRYGPPPPGPRMGPPPPPMERRPPPPRPGWAWHGGYYRWGGGRYIWVPGSYMAPPRPGVIWVAGRWMSTPRGWVWREGYWR